MLKISIAESKAERRLVLEGQIVGGSVGELRNIRTLLTSELNGRSLFIDLQNVTQLSQEGENVLFSLMGQGAKLCPTGVVARYLLQQFARRSTEPGNGPSNVAPMLIGQLQRNLASVSAEEEYASRDDIDARFDEELTGLYLLSYALTGDHAKAEECLLAALDESLNETPAFKHSGRAWARDRIIDMAFQTVCPRATDTQSNEADSNSNRNGSPFHFCSGDPTAILFRLTNFQRFVFVISVLERYKDQDCASLLRCTELQVREARTEAFRAIAHVGFDKPVSQPGEAGCGAERKQRAF